MWNRLCEAITPKQVPMETISANAFIEEVLDEETSITVPNVVVTDLLGLSLLIKSASSVGAGDVVVTTNQTKMTFQF
jgi:hypothetical protein